MTLFRKLFSWSASVYEHQQANPTVWCCQVASHFAIMKGTAYMEKQKFLDNFWRGFKQVGSVVDWQRSMKSASIPLLVHMQHAKSISRIMTPSSLSVCQRSACARQSGTCWGRFTGSGVVSVTWAICRSACVSFLIRPVHVCTLSCTAQHFLAHHSTAQHSILLWAHV